jgi:hypothetical protein
MRLPYLQNALVEQRKVCDYLLSEERSEGKAAFFIAFGFSLVRWELLRDALLAHAASYDVARTVSSPHGIKYIIEGTLQTPDARNPSVRAVWIVDSGAVAPRLVTAYPL